MKFYRVTYPEKTEPREVWFRTKGQAMRAYNKMVRTMNDSPSEYDKSPVSIEYIFTAMTTINLTISILNDEEWIDNRETLHQHRITQW